MLGTRDRFVRIMFTGALFIGGNLVALAQPVSLPAEFFSNPPEPAAPLR